MPAHSKFTRARAATAVEILAAGGSRREAARRIGVDHQTLGRWIARGDRQLGSGTRFAVFAEAVHLAETPTAPPILVALRDLKVEYSRWEADPVAAWKFLERAGEPGFARPDPPQPLRVQVVHSTLPKGDSA